MHAMPETWPGRKNESSGSIPVYEHRETWRADYGHEIRATAGGADTVRSSRKYTNLKENPRVAWVVGCTTEVTVQYEGEAEGLEGEALAKYKPIYFQKFTDGPARENWAGITYFVVRPKWVRHCDYNPESRRIEEQRF
jgi:hypothetical protein